MSRVYLEPARREPGYLLEMYQMILNVTDTGSGEAIDIPAPYDGMRRVPQHELATVPAPSAGRRVAVHVIICVCMTVIY